MLTQIHSVIDLIFPPVCPICESVLLPNKNAFTCLICDQQLNETSFFENQNNEMIDRFIGRIPVVFAASLYRFHAGSKSQKLIHNIKYGGYAFAARRLGRYLGEKLSHADRKYWPDLILPVPLNKKKMRKRGFNQSASLASQLAKSLTIPYQENLIKRKIDTTSQTGLSREKRLMNMSGAFMIDPRRSLSHDIKTVMIVDDVVTTGATIEACCKTMLDRWPGLKFSILSVCLAT